MYACIFVPVIDCTCVLRCHAEPHSLPCRWIADPVYRQCWPVSPVYYRVTSSYVTAAEFQTQARFYNTFTSDFVEWKSTELWLLERCRAQILCSVCCERLFGDLQWKWEWVTKWYDYWSPHANPLSLSAVFFATIWHCRELSDERYADHIQFKYWLLQWLTPRTTDRSPPVLRRHQPVLLSTTLCHDASAVCR